jgi:hypothetical protein
VDQTTPTQDGSAAWNLITGMTNVVGTLGGSGYSPTTAPLITVPTSTTTPHFATLTADQVTTITNWLALEQTWRVASGGGSGTTPIDYLAQWSGCMQYTDFTTANVAQAFADEVETSEGYCKQCHVNGQAQSYFIATPDAQNMFTAITTYREYLSTFFTIDTTTTPPSVIVNTIPFKLAADGGVNGLHPNNWNPTTNKGMTALNDFWTLTVAHLNDTTAPACVPSTLTD